MIVATLAKLVILVSILGRHGHFEHVLIQKKWYPGVVQIVIHAVVYLRLPHHGQILESDEVMYLHESCHKRDQS